MRKKISFVAIGQAGGNIGKLFEEQGFTVLYVNTSSEDLDTLKNVKYKYHIPEGEGCNKDRHKAKQLIIDDFDNIAQEIDSKINADIIFVVFASGGGTGSGAGPMLIDLLIDEGKTIGAITVLPSIKESIKSQINAYECFSELIAIEGCASTFVIDNDKGEKLSLNTKFVNNFCSFIEIPDKHKSVKGNIDKAEIEETLKAHGMSMIVKTAEKSSAGLIQAFKNNCFAPIEADRTVKYIAYSLCGDLDNTEIEKAVGVPLDTFQTYNDKETICALSGLSYPQSRLDIIYDKIKANEEIIVKNLKATTEIKMKDDVNFLSNLSSNKSNAKDEKKPQSKRDIMNKYLRG